MTNKDNTILWILGIILVIVFIGKSGNLGLFSTQPVCMSNEPTTLEGYYNEFKELYGEKIILFNEEYLLGKSIEEGIGFVYYKHGSNLAITVYEIENCNELIETIRFDYGHTTKIINGRTLYVMKEGPAEDAEVGDLFCSTNGNFIIKFSPINEAPKLLDLEQAYFNKFYTCESVYPPPSVYPTSDEMKELMYYFEDESSFKDRDKSIFYTGSNPYSEYFFMEFPGVDKFCSNWYLNPKADFLDGSNQQTWTIEERTKNNKKYFYVKNPSSPIMNGYYWCHNPNLMGYASSEVLMDKFFDKFYKISIEPQKCYAYLAETCQEVPCSTNYTKFNTLEKCVAIITEKNCSLLSLELRDDCCVKNFGENYKWEENSCKSQNGFEIKWWMILIGAGIVFIIIIILNKK